MANPTDIRKGRVIIYNGVPHSVLDAQHRTQGRQAGFMQVTMRNLETGASTNNKFRSTDSVDFCHTSSNALEFSYVDGDGYHFMDTESYEDILLSADLMEDIKQYLVEGNSYDILFVDDKPMEVQLPSSVEMKVVDAPDAVKGDTASNVQKPVTTESGLVVQVPLFIKKDEVIKVNTENGTYMSRA